MTLKSPIQTMIQFSDNEFRPLENGTVHVFEAGTLTPKQTYRDAQGTIPDTHPIFLDAAGRAPIFLDGAYRRRVYDAMGVLVEDLDNLQNADFGQLGVDTKAAILADLSSGDAGKGDALVAVKQPFAGSVLRTQHDKNSESLSVSDFKLATDLDDSLSFQRAIDALSPNGGSILVPTKSYIINTLPNHNGKSIDWDFQPNCIFSGSQTGINGGFPRAQTNISMYPLNRMMQSRSSELSTPSNATGVFVVESIKPKNVDGGHVAIYGAAANDSNTNNSNAWAANFLVRTEDGATGGAWGIEIDVDTFSANTIEFGLDITGVGVYDPENGIVIQRADGTIWNVGLSVRKCGVGIAIFNHSRLSRGLVIAEPTPQDGTSISSKQLKNGKDNIFLQRFTDTNPAGYFLSCVNTANTEQIFSVGVNGDIVGKNLAVKSEAVPTFANALCVGSGITTTASAGGASALPAVPAGYLTFYHGANLIKIPFYL